MKQFRTVLTLASLLATVSWASAALAQEALPTAVRPMQLSAFGGVSGVFTGLSGGKNFSITAGGDLALPNYRRVRPVIEVRGTYPADRGLVDSQKSILGGLRVDFLLGRRIHPYGDFLLGRGETNYRFGYLFGNQVFLLTTTNVFSPGAGFDYNLTDHWAVKVDGQFQHWSEAPTPSGTIYSKIGTAAVVYRFGFGRRSKP
jgi:opacity protein-like surface antigen